MKNLGGFVVNTHVLSDFVEKNSVFMLDLNNLILYNRYDIF